MGKVTIRHYVVRARHGKRLAYWQPTAEMRAAGFQMIACGEDGPAAWEIAARAEASWQAHRRGQDAKPPRYLRGSLGEAFERYRTTSEWARKAPRTREEWDRGWKYIERYFGRIDPSTVGFDVIDAWYAAMLDDHSTGEAYRAMKIWRALWNVAAAMQYCERGKDPSQGIRRQTPRGRSESWQADEIRRLINRAWRDGFHGLACAISIAWDTGLSPVDVRTLKASQRIPHGRWGAFQVERAKTGSAALGTLSRLSAALLAGHQAMFGAGVLPSAPVIRTRRGKPYSKNDLAKDFRKVRARVFPGDTRRLMDIRRSVAIEARAGGASMEQMSAKLANRMDRNAGLESTYLPVDRAAVASVDSARLRARRKGKGDE